MATPNSSGSTPARPNDSTYATENSAGADGRWFSSSEIAELRRVFVLSGQDPSDSPLASVVIGIDDKELESDLNLQNVGAGIALDSEWTYRKDIFGNGIFRIVLSLLSLRLPCVRTEKLYCVGICYFTED